MLLFFGKKNNEGVEEKKGVESALSIIANGTTIIGDVVSDGDIRIEGKIIGQLLCKSKVVVGPKGRIEGNIDTVNATIAGEVYGKILVRDLLQLQETARIYGDVCTQKIAISQGAVFNGNSKTGPEAQEQIKQTPIVDLLANHKRENGKLLEAGDEKIFAANGADKRKTEKVPA